MRVRRSRFSLDLAPILRREETRGDARRAETDEKTHAGRLFRAKGASIARKAVVVSAEEEEENRTRARCSPRRCRICSGSRDRRWS